jgi:gliding motility-associated-like protein
MRNRNSICLLCVFLAIGAGERAVCQNYVFAQLTGTPINTTGWVFSGDAKVTNIIGSADSEVMLTRAAMLDDGGVFFSQPINLAFCNKWIAEFDFRMYDGTGADGIAFCFLDVPPSNYVNGGGLGIPDVANGLKVCFDTWNNCVDPGDYDSVTVHQDMPKIEIRWGKGYDEMLNSGTLIYGECVSQPTVSNTNGRLNYIRGPNYNRAKIEYDTGRISVYVNDTLYISTYQPGQFNFTGYMGFTAGTGGFYDNQSIKNVIIYTEMPAPYAGPPQAFCPYDTVALGGPANPLYVYAWSPPAGLSDTASSAPLLHLRNDTTVAGLHTYYVKTAFADNPGCTSLDSVVVKVYANPTVNFTMPGICLSDVVGQFYDSSYTEDRETLPFTYNWNFGDANALPPGNPNHSTLQNPTHNYSAAANYLMSLTVTNSVGCVDSAVKTFTVNGTHPQSAFSIIDPSGLCSNAPVGVTNLSTVDFGSVVMVQIYWGDSSGVFYTDSVPYDGKVYLHSYPNPVTNGDVGYTIRMVSASGITCDNESDQSVNVQPAPHVQFNAIPAVCDYPFLQVNITEASELTGLPGNFAYSGRGMIGENVLRPLYAGPGTDTLECKFVATNGCVDSADQTVFIQALPGVSAGNDTSVVVGQPLQLHAFSTDGSGDSFLWSPVNDLNDPAISDPVAILSSEVDSIRYTVTVTDSLGCMVAASIEVTVFKSVPDIFVPNAFTPGKNTNTIFRPIPVGISSLQSFCIYNRYGQLLYSTTRIGEGWDGTMGGRAQPEGSYVWVVQGTTYTGKIIAKKGTMVLIR